MDANVNRSEIDFSQPVEDTLYISEPNYFGTGVISYMVKPDEESINQLKLSAKDIIESDRISDLNTVYVRCEITQKTENFDVRIEDAGLAFCSTPLLSSEKECIKTTFDKLCIEETGKSFEENVMDIKLGAEREERQRVIDDYER